MTPSASDPQALQAAAATLVLTEGAQVDLLRCLHAMGDPQDLAALQQQLCVGDRQSRARSIAVIVARLRLALDAWRLA